MVPPISHNVQGLRTGPNHFLPRSCSLPSNAFVPRPRPHLGPVGSEAALRRPEPEALLLGEAANPSVGLSPTIILGHRWVGTPARKPPRYRNQEERVQDKINRRPRREPKTIARYGSYEETPPSAYPPVFGNYRHRETGQCSRDRTHRSPRREVPITDK